VEGVYSFIKESMNHLILFEPVHLNEHTILNLFLHIRLDYF